MQNIYKGGMVLPIINESEVKQQIKSGRFSNLYFIYGEEKYLVKHYTDLLMKKIVPQDFADFNLHIYDGKSPDFDDISNAAEALPIFSQYSCICIKDLHADSLNADSSDKLEKLISDISDSTVIIISLPTVDVNMKSAKGKKLLGLFEKYGSVLNFDHAGMGQLSKLIERGAKERGCEFAYSEANYLISLVGDDMTVILNELEKICAYKKGGKINKSDIDAVVVKNTQARAFDLAKALTSNNCDMAMSILDTLFYMREEPVNILSAMITPYIDMYRAKVFVSGGMRAEDAAGYFNYKNKEFRLTNGARTAAKYSMTQLRQFLEVLNDADIMLKSSTVDGRLVLEQTITKLLLVSNGEKIC